MPPIVHKSESDEKIYDNFTRGTLVFPKMMDRVTIHHSYDGMSLLKLSKVSSDLEICLEFDGFTHDPSVKPWFAIFIVGRKKFPISFLNEGTFVLNPLGSYINNFSMS